MANVFSSSTPANGREAMYTFKELLKTAGWVHQASSTGNGGAFTVVPGNVNDLITAGAMFPNNSAWWVGRSPDAQREIMIQKGTTNLVWRAKYSYSAHFTGGVPSTTVPPTATDGQDIAGTDAPAYVTFFAADGTYRLKVMAQDTTPYGWWALGHPNAGGTGNFSFAMDPMKTGTYPAQDVDPYVFFIPHATNAYKVASWGAESTTNGILAYLRKGMLGEGWVVMVGGIYANASSAITMSTNPVSAKDDILPFMYFRFPDVAGAFTAPVGFKGMSTLFGFIGAIRTPPDTLSVVGVRDKIVIGDLCADWDGSVPI